MRDKLITIAASAEDDAFIKLVAREIVERTQPQQAIPEVYGHYRLVVRDGIEFFLSQISSRRLPGRNPSSQFSINHNFYVGGLNF